MNIGTLTTIIKLLRPKYYNIITKILVTGGLSLLTKPIWVDLINIFFTEFNFSLIGQYDWAIGLAIIVLSLTYNTLNKYIDLRFVPNSEPAFKQINTKKKSDFGELCQEILPILKDNEYIFLSTGPNSGMNNVDKLRTDLTMWNELKKNVILPNNENLKKLILDNLSLIPANYEEEFRKIIIHIDAFRKHIENSNFDYSDFQFPKSFPDLIKNKCFEKAKDDKILKKKFDWLSKKLKKIGVSNWIAFGSSILTPQKANDFDIALLIENTIDNRKINDQLLNMKFDFKVKFKHPLHITVFTDEDAEDYTKFLSQNVLKIEMKNGKRLTLHN